MPDIVHIHYLGKSDRLDPIPVVNRAGGKYRLGCNMEIVVVTFDDGRKFKGVLHDVDPSRSCVLHDFFEAYVNRLIAMGAKKVHPSLAILWVPTGGYMVPFLDPAFGPWRFLLVNTNTEEETRSLGEGKEIR
jgi:small nuclear ribonucleoprotein (snRNP)-like protein